MHPQAKPFARTPILGSTLRKFPLRQGALWLAIIAVWSLGWLSWDNLRAFIQADRLADQALEVRFETEALLSGLKDAETGQLGYIITGDPAYLEPYHAAVAETPRILDRLSALVSSPVQQRRLAMLEPLVADRLDLISANIEMREALGSEVFDPGRLARGRSTMDEIRGVVAAMIAEESGIHAERAVHAEGRATAIAWALLIGILISTIAIVGVFYVMLAETRRRRRAEAQLQQLNRSLNQSNAELEDRVRARTIELIDANELLKTEAQQRSEVAETLRQSNEILNALFDSSPFAIIALDPAYRVLAWNEAASRIFGYGADEVLGQPYPLVPHEHEEQFESLMDRVATGQSLHDVAVRRRRKDGSMIDIRSSGAPLYDATGAQRGAVYILEDVTEQKAVQRQLEHAQRMEAVGQLTGGMAHDFNNLLTIIIGNLDLIENDLAGRPQALALARSALDAGLRGAELSRKLLAFSRQQSLEPAALDLNGLVHDMTDLLRRTLGEQIEIDACLAGDLEVAFADRAQVESALVNLAVNARDAMPDGGRLTIETANQYLDKDYAEENAEVAIGHYIMLAVSDTGTGIPPQALAHVFEPFFTTKDEGKGTGLGLSMIYGFAKQSGGHVKIYSEPGHGTTVRLYLPRSESEIALPDRAATDDIPTSLTPAKILVVEDNPGVRKVVAAQLVELGYQVVESEAPAAALQLVEQGQTIDLLFTDIVMPGEMTGYDLARAVRALRPDIKILFTSGFADASLRSGERFPGPAPMLSKPYRKHDLAEKIYDVLYAEDVHRQMS